MEALAGVWLGGIGRHWMEVGWEGLEGNWLQGIGRYWMVSGWGPLVGNSFGGIRKCLTWNHREVIE